MSIEEFALKYPVRIKNGTRRDECGEMIIPGKKFGDELSHIFDYGDGVHFGLCLMFPVPKTWNNRRKALVAAGFTIKQDAHTEGIALFDPTNSHQAKLALKFAGVRPNKNLTPEQRAEIARRFHKSPKTP